MKFFNFGRAKREQPPTPAPKAVRSPQAATPHNTKKPPKKEEAKGQDIREEPSKRAGNENARRHVAADRRHGTDVADRGAQGREVRPSSVAFALPERTPQRTPRPSRPVPAPALDSILSIPSPHPPQRLTKRSTRAPFEDASQFQEAGSRAPKTDGRRSHLLPQTHEIVAAPPPPRIALAAGKVRQGVDRLRPATHRYDRLGPEVAAWVRDKGLVEVVDGPDGPTDRVTAKIERGSKRLERLGFESAFPSLSRQQRVAVLDVLDEGRRSAGEGRELNLTVAVQDKLTNPKLNYRF